MSKMDTHASAPAYERERRHRHALLARAERHLERPLRAVRVASGLHHCPHCGHGLSARYRVPGAQHLRRNTRPRVVCNWQP